VVAQKRSVAEEILEILRAENKISDEKYQELMSRAKPKMRQERRELKLSPRSSEERQNSSRLA
jgi:hypothetical protein